MPLKKRSMFYIGLTLITMATVFLGFILYFGPHSRLSGSDIIVKYDHPYGVTLNNIEPGAELELNFESTEPVNIIVMKREDSGDYFLLEDTSVTHYILDAEATSGTYHHTFDEPGNWKIYFENPHPPSKLHPAPSIDYWGQLMKPDDTLVMYYLNIGIGITILILGILFLVTSRHKKVKSKKSKKKSKNND